MILLTDAERKRDMKNSRIKSVMKNLSLATVGALVLLGFVVVPKMTVKAVTANTYNETTKTLTLNEAIAEPTSMSSGSAIELPSNCPNKNDVEHIIATSSCVLNTNSEDLFYGYINVKDIDLSNAQISTALTNLNSFFN